MGFRNRVKFTTLTTGTGSVTVDAAVSSYQTPVDAGVEDGEAVRYTIENGTDWEIGRAVASSTSTVFSRELEESSTGSLLNLTSGAVMFFTPSADQVGQFGTRGRQMPVGVGQYLN